MSLKLRKCEQTVAEMFDAANGIIDSGLLKLYPALEKYLLKMKVYEYKNLDKKNPQSLETFNKKWGIVIKREENR